LIPAFKASFSSPKETTSAPRPLFFNSLMTSILELALTAKQINGLEDLNADFNFIIFLFSWSNE